MSSDDTSRQAVLPRSLRRPAACVAGVAALVFAAFALRYRGGSSPRWLDSEIQGLVGPAAPGRTAWNAVIDLGDGHSVVVLAMVLAVLAWALGRRRTALLALVGPGLTGASTTLAKPLVGRTMEGVLAYPSGHAAGATALGLVAALLLVSVLRTTAEWASAAVVAGGALLSGGVMALALVADHDHYATDTLGGFAVAVAVVLGAALAIERWGERGVSPSP